jgi:hypothetical protein
MIYVIGKMDLRKRENEMFVEVLSISIKKSSSFLLTPQINISTLQILLVFLSIMEFVRSIFHL